MNRLKTQLNFVMSWNHIWRRNQNEDKSEVNLVKQIPDFDTELDQSISFVFESEITKKALVRPPFDNFANILL